MSKKIDNTVELNPKIVKVMGGFRPTIGNNNDIQIVETYTKLLNLETLKTQSMIRAEKAGKVFKPTKSTLNEIEEVEKRLLWLIKKE